MGKIRTRIWDPGAYLTDLDKIVAYLDAALEEGDPALVAAALGDIARARGMTQVARAAGLGRESLYKALSDDGNPELATVLRVVHALGLRLTATAAPKGSGAQRRSPPSRSTAKSYRGPSRRSIASGAT